MGVLESVILVFALCFAIQLSLFRLTDPLRPFRWLFAIFLSGLVVALVMTFSKWSLLKQLHFALFYLSVFGTYLVTYLNTREPGPSFLMLRFIERHKGAKRDEFNRVITRENIWSHRVGEMIKGKIVILKNGRFEITPYGRRYLWFFTFYRRLLGVRDRGG